jgi:cytoskeletal protein CcmA (bactofilin family)
MAIFGKDRERGERPRAGSFDGPVSSGGGEADMQERDKARNAQDGSASSAFLGKGSRVVGSLIFEGPARIEGTVEGDITAQDVITIGESAVLNAKIVGTAVVIHGRVTGDVTARTRLEIRAPGRVIGNIVTPNLVIHDGVVFEGQCTMGIDPRGAEKDRKVTRVLRHGDRDGDSADAPRVAAESAK